MKPHCRICSIYGFFLMLASAVGLPGLASAGDMAPLPTASKVEFQRYSGRWYEISRLPMWFERKCIGDVTATYTPRPDERLEVINRCRTEDGFISARGIAEASDPTRPGQLRVRFAPDWLAWLPVVWGDYWILDIDSDYQWVLIGAPSRNYLWILARTPSLNPFTVAALKQYAAEQGFDIAQMVDVGNAVE